MASLEQWDADEASGRRIDASIRKGTVDNQTKIKRSVAFSLGHAEQGGMRRHWLEVVH